MPKDLVVPDALYMGALIQGQEPGSRTESNYQPDQRDIIKSSSEKDCFQTTEYFDSTRGEPECMTRLRH